ncbi:hypothetical protein Q3G72_025272 [Acer saccharum]|nr:hypothetical protein Q3G72_025272 [Acer saccharum]
MSIPRSRTRQTPRKGTWVRKSKPKSVPLSYTNAKLSIGKKRAQDLLTAREDFSSPSSGSIDSRSSFSDHCLMKGECSRSAKGVGPVGDGPIMEWATAKRLDFSSEVETGEISRSIAEDIQLGQGFVAPREITGIIVDLTGERGPNQSQDQDFAQLGCDGSTLMGLESSEDTSSSKVPMIADEPLFQKSNGAGPEEVIPSVATPAKKSKKIRGGKKICSAKCHSMVTRTSKGEEDRQNQGEQRAQKVVRPRTWNLAVEMTKVIEKGVAMGALSNANRDSPSAGSGEQWNLDIEVAKIIETGKALGFDFDGSEEEVTVFVANRETEDEARDRGQRG